MSKSVMKRRSLLKALGGSAFLGVPVFRSALLEAQGSTPLRFLAIHFPGGVVGQPASSWSFQSVLSPLSSLQEDLLVLRNMNNPSAEKIINDGRGEGHGAGMRTILTGDSRGPDHEDSRDIDDVPGTDPAIYFGPITSIDQMIGKQLGSGLRIPSLQLGVITDKVPEQSLGHRRLSFDNGSPITPIQAPRAAFDRLFAAGVPSATPPATGTETVSPELERAWARQRSILDLLKSEIADVQSLTSSAERQKLEEHLTSLRELEARLGGGGPAVGNPNAGCMAPEVGDPADFRGIGTAMNALTYQAMNCDLTRAITLQWMHSGDQWEHFPWLSVARDHHGMEHGWDGNPNGPVGTDLTKVQTWLMTQVAELLTVMKQTQEADGTMLDNSIVYVASEMTDGGWHSHSPVVGFVAGKAGGRIQPGRLLDAGGRSQNDLLTTFVQLMGLNNVSAVGDAAFNTAPLSLG